MYYVYAQWLLNEGNSSKRGFYGTHGPPSGSATAALVLTSQHYLAKPKQELNTHSQAGIEL